MPTSEKNGADDCLELDCTPHQLTNGSISKSYAGTIFLFCCGSFTEAELATLKQSSQSRNDVRLLFPDSKVRLVGIQIERLDAGTVRIGGNVGELSVYRPDPHVLG